MFVRRACCLAASLGVGVMLSLGMRCGNGDVAQSLQQNIAPDATVQSLIDRAVEAFAAIKEGHVGLEEAFRRLSELKAMLRDDVKLVQQLVYYETQVTDERKSLMLYLLFDYGDISHSEIAFALAPFVCASDASLRRKVHHRLDRVDQHSDLGRAPNYRHYHNVIASQKDKPPLALILYMYRIHPGTALLTLTRVYRRDAPGAREILWAEHVIADTLWKHEHGFLPTSKVEPQAMAELEKLSNDEAWWVRLYVATIIRQHPAFRRPEIVARLEKDSHPLVREAMAYTQPQPPPARGAPSPPTPPRPDKPK